MENIAQRLQRLSEPGCTVAGFTVNNADKEHQDKFLELFKTADNLEILILTALEDFSIAKTDATWQKRKEQTEKYRTEAKIEFHPERIAYFLEYILPEIIKIIPSKITLQELCILNVALNLPQKESLTEIFSKMPNLKKVEFENLKI